MDVGFPLSLIVLASWTLGIWRDFNYRHTHHHR